VRTPFADSPEFRRLLAGEPRVSLPRIAMEIARDAYPEIEVDAYLRRIDALADRVRQRFAADAKPRTILGQINWVLFIEEGFRGNAAEYYDPRNSYLNEVLERKTGIPISLSVLYSAVAAPLGLDLTGVNLPAHFVLRLDSAEPPLFVDAFHAGALLDRDGCGRRVSAAVGRPVTLSDAQLAPTDAASTVARMLRNLKAIYVREDDFASALPVARRIAALDPAIPEEQRDWGLLAYQAGHPGEAVLPLSRYLESRPQASDTAPIAELLRAARRDIAQNN
jgi:regulator of sirC expression with transglutaminase-like and TPR domain